MPFRNILTPLIAIATSLTADETANALSCARPEISQSFEQWSQSPKQYVLVRGVLSPTLPLPKPPLPSNDINRPNPPAPHLYDFSGVVIGRQQNKPWSGQVMVVPTCIAAWCGEHVGAGGKPGNEAIMAFEVTGGRYTLTYGPCGGQSFTQNLDQNETALRACLNGNCPAPSQN